MVESTSHDQDCRPGMVLTAGQYTAIVETVRPMARNTWCVRLRQPQLAQQITPGQFFMIRPDDGSDPLLGRPFALYDTWDDEDDDPAGVDFGFVVVGKMTTLMTQWQPGDEVRLWGPLGNGFAPPTAKNLICVAGGIGQTPFLAVAMEALGLRSYGSPVRAVPQRPENVKLCYGVRSADYLAGLDDFDIRGLDVRIATDDGTEGHHGYVTELLDQCLTEESAETQVYCCGPEPMMKAVAQVCENYGTPCWLSLETPMACGFGACFSCVATVREDDGTTDYRRTCVEGPVFRAEKLVL